MGSGEMRGKRMRWWAAGQWSNLVGFKIFHHAVDVLERGHSVFFTLSFHRRGLRNGVNGQQNKNNKLQAETAAGRRPQFSELCRRNLIESCRISLPRELPLLLVFLVP